jgi:hypothetical protein
LSQDIENASEETDAIKAVFSSLQSEQKHLWVENFLGVLMNPGFFIAQICPYKLEFLSHFVQRFDAQKYKRPSSVFLDFFRKNNFEHQGFFFANLGACRQFLRHHAKNVDRELGLRPLSLQRTIPHAGEHLFNALNKN